MKIQESGDLKGFTLCWPKDNFTIDSFRTSHSKQHRTFGGTNITDVLLLTLLKSFLLGLSPFANSKETSQPPSLHCHSNITIFSPKQL